MHVELKCRLDLDRYSHIWANSNDNAEGWVRTLDSRKNDTIGIEIDVVDSTTVDNGIKFW